jgi:hypothetical protein
MGTYADKPDAAPFVWGDVTNPAGGYNGAYDLVTQKFESTMQTAEDMLVRLVGTDGSSGYLGSLNAIIGDYVAPVITPLSVDVPDLVVPVDARPAIDTSGLDMDFPEFTALPPSLLPLPAVDLSAVLPADMPEDITVALSWLESAHDTTLYSELLARMIADLQTGATGLNATVEQEIFDRALARQAAENTKTYSEIEDYFSSRGFELPPGAMAGRLQEAANEIARNNLDLNGKIMIEQAELAQKNSQFMIQAAKDLEAVLRDFTNKRNDHTLDYAKAVAANSISLYSEKVKAYVSAMEANKAYVEIQVENLKAAVESNKGLVASFAAEAEAYRAIIDAKSKKNEALVSVIKAEIEGYDSETKAIASNYNTQIAAWGLKIQNADLQLRAAITNADSSLKAFVSESSLREKVAEAMANIAMQSVASAYGAVNASAGLTTQTSHGENETWSHGESRSIGMNISSGLSETHPFDPEPLV